MASTKRERELARRRVERQAARRAELEARRRRRRATLLKSLAALVVVGVAATLVALKYDFSKDKPKAAAAAACTYNKAGQAAKPVSGLPPSTPAKAEGTQKATITTNRGPITISLLNAKAPCTVNSFTFLAGQKYFDGTSCHRLTSGGLSVLQCGDPKGDGQGGPGYQFAEENLTGAKYPRGTVAMARTSTPGTNGSQFFLVYGDSLALPPDYTPFGTITDGLKVLDAIAKGGSDPAGDGKPKLPVTITSVTIT
ncbi:MAG: putative peptidyl-prolyl cis-trans isomerase cyclophilin type [Frankiales bacterium]|nr:putative peptidyl-prolyl cis-trans isomerase cyclophilin type [Frankiales bacterium]